MKRSALNNAGDGHTSASMLSPATKRPKTIEELYQDREHKEHILERPDTYIGSVRRNLKETLWVFNCATKRFECLPNAEMVPGLFKIFDEVLNNATDALTRSKGKKAPLKIVIAIDQGKGTFAVNNTGSIHIAVHKKTKKYVPEMVFGSLLTSTNYDDSEQRATIGRNGLGVKLTNIFSQRFTVKCRTGKRTFEQHFSHNMSNRQTPKIATLDAPAAYDMVAVRFVPDWSRLDRGSDTLAGNKQFSDTMMGMFAKRIVDLAAWNPDWRIKFNGTLVRFESFDAYARLYLKSSANAKQQPVLYRELAAKQWRVGVTLCEQDSFQHQSFVNHGETSRGGTHLERIVSQIVNFVSDKVWRKNKKVNVHAVKKFIRDQLFVFVYCQVDKPEFDTQSKEELTKKLSEHECKLSKLPKTFMEEICKTFPLVDQAIQQSQLKERQRVTRHMKGYKLSAVYVDKLADAKLAGTRRSHECRLFLTEGDSAKTMAMSGFEVIGSECNGVFPLKGKLLNVRDVSNKKLSENAEVRDICKILGLDMNRTYESDEDVSRLRYGHVCVMADQDKDGFHICGLILNFLYTFWPALFNRERFIQRFITPIVKVSKRGQEDQLYFNESDYKHWLTMVANNEPAKHGYRIKYYKGLGTSTPQEAKQYFKQLDRHLIVYRHQRLNDFDMNCAMKDAFDKKQADARKQWLRHYWQTARNEHQNRSGDEIMEIQDTYRYFFEDELLQYFDEAVQRSVPSMLDGLKPSQRKVLWACFKRSLTDEIKVAQLAGYVSEHAAYHHGEASLNGTIVKMAQSYCGANNVNLIEPNGQFGSRIQNGKDAASPRYIFTQLAPWTRVLFHRDDDPVLTTIEDDGQHVEPEFYVPIIPMVCCNGASGVGTGWSTDLPLYNPRDIIEQCRRMCRNEPVESLMPWYRGFKGTVTVDPHNTRRFLIHGCYKLDAEKRQMTITELPVGTAYDTYRAQLDAWQLAIKKNKEPLYKKLIDSHMSDTRVRFVLSFNEQQWQNAHEIGFEKLFKLVTVVHTSNCHLFDQYGVLQRYPDGPADIVPAFGAVRLDYYERRRQQLLEHYNRQATRALNKHEFIEATINKDIELAGKPKSEWIRVCKQRGWALLTEYEPNDQGCHYLIQLPMASLTKERSEQLSAEVDRLYGTIAALEKTTPQQMWLKDLDACEKALSLL